MVEHQRGNFGYGVIRWRPIFGGIKVHANVAGNFLRDFPSDNALFKGWYRMMTPLKWHGGNKRAKGPS